MNHRTIRRAAAAALITATITTTAAACGPADTDAGAKNTPSTSPAKPKDAFDGLTGAQISDKAKTALKSVTSLRVTGDAPDGSGSTITVNMAMDTKGSCRGTITQPGAGVIDIIKNRSSIFMKGDETFWRASLASDKKKLTAKQTDAVLELVKGRWMKVDKKTAKAMTRKDMCDLSTLADELKGDSPADTSRGADITRAGQPLAVIYDRGDADTVTTVHVAKTGKPYPVEIINTGGTDAGSLKFTDFNKPVDTTPPPADQILDPKKLSR
ncbi:hypothetical protein ACFY7C_36540 [Streptomyces sp. NPDC012769]|uniref:hypothetical protein n=1 Tax=Streptomyces sp. NPDC012769 TaxID=3364848 RepID=UPI00369C1051